MAPSMIRRADGDDWLIISQVDHAHVAGEMARAWGSAAVAELPFRDLLLPAVWHHDDGWRPWEQRPCVDRQTGLPRSFMEMPMAEATAIWTRSIDACAGLSGLGGLWVSLHFCWLAEHATTSDPHDVRAIQTFLAQQKGRRRDWRQLPGPALAPSELDRAVDVGFRYLQLFDAVSLWLCCAPPAQSLRIRSPEQVELHFQPRAPVQASVHPYPFVDGILTLDVVARRIAARPYDDAQLQAALADAARERLEWILRPDA